MDCRRFEELLFEAVEVSEELGAHARSCDRCAELLAAFATELDLDVVGGVLAQTSGDPCAAAAGRLCETIDAGVKPASTLRLHLADCPQCTALHAAMLALPRDLAQLARQEPDAEFVADVVARTSGRRRVVVWWQALLTRPRLALEGAYLGTALLALLLGPSMSAFARTPVLAAEQLRDAGAQGQQVVAATIDKVADVGGEALQQTRQQADQWLAATARQAGEQLSTIFRSLDDFWGRVRGEDAVRDEGTAPEDSARFDQPNGNQA